MAEAGATVAGRMLPSLPPKVVGDVTGHLAMKVDQVLWARQPPGDVSAVVMWWGGEEATTFRPTDVAEESAKRRPAGVVYEIRTSVALFDKYLRKCGSLEIAIADKYGMPIGCVSVPNLWQMINACPYQGYYPIVNNFGNRIGDLHVSFNLRMSPSTDTSSAIKSTTKNTNVKTKEPKRLSSVKKSHFTKEAKTMKNERVILDNFSKPEVSSSSAQKSVSNDSFVKVDSQDSVNRVSPTSNIISEILEHGTRLRDAMTASVMEDGIQLDLKSIPKFDILSSDILKCVGLPQTLDSFALCNTHVGPMSQNPCAKKNSTVSQKKVLDYLSGKPMSSLEEEEALSTLRNITPTKDIIERVVPDPCREFVIKAGPEESSKTRINIPKDLDKTGTKVMDDEKNSCLNINECSFEVDSQILSQINCLRVTVYSLVLNSVGTKRVRNAPRKKGPISVSNTSMHPPGVTYFVEYKFPLVSESRSWESDVRYCSKRFNGHEIAFGDRTVHNIPETWRCSISEETNLCSLISSLSFKVCARHLHQRVPVCLGSAAPDSAKELLNSSHLRHDFDLPVIASDCLPVAQLKICLELGRDRIHFGGLLDPENNSLGIGSPRKSCSSKKSQLSLKNVTGKKQGRSVATVTRNIHSKHSSVYKWKSGVPQQASQADKVIKRLVAEANSVSKPSYVSDSSSAPSSARPKLKPQSSKSLPYVPGRKSSLSKQHVDSPTVGQILKHELAVSVLQIIDSKYLKCYAAEDRGFYVSYKFPVSNTLKNELVDWDSVCTEPSECSDGTWPKSQNKIHTAVLPKQREFHGFLEQAFQLQGIQNRACVVFSLIIRTYGEKVRDQKVAEACLPLSCMHTLEEAYNDASKNNTSFSPSSCSSVVLDLPLEDLSLGQSYEPTGNSGSLRLKLDYRCSDMEIIQKSHLPRSRGDSVTDNLPCYDFAEIPYQKQKAEIGVVLRESFDLSGAVPRWAAEKRLPSKQSEDTFLVDNTISQESYSTGDFNHHDKNYSTKTQHASWSSAEQGNRSRIPSRMSDSAYQLSSSCKPEDHQTIVDVIDLANEMSQCAVDKKSPSANTSSRLHGVEDSSQKGSRVVDAVTSTSPSMQHKQTRSTGTSPIAPVSGRAARVHTATSTERVHARDETQQAVIESVSQGSQTTPRERKETPQRDVSMSPSPNGVTSQKLSEMQLPSRSRTTTVVLPQRSIDDVEIVSEHEFGSCGSVHRESSEDTHHEVSSVNETDKTSNSLTSTFQAKIGVECALHLQTSSPSSKHSGPNNNSLVFVSINPCGVDGRISAHMGLDPVSISPAVENNGEPEWHWQTQVQLPIDLLVSTVKRLIFKLWSKDEANHHERLSDNSSTSLIGFSALDLTVLSAGLPFICGWYNVMDFSGACRGQIKLSVEPLQSVSTLVDASSLIYTNETQSDSPLSMFVAHGAYPEFPSHVTQFPDMRIQKVDPQPSDVAMASVLSGYQLVRNHCQKHCSDRHDQPQEEIDDNARSRTHTKLQRKKDTLTEASLPDLGQLNITATETASAPTASLPSAGTGSESVVEVEKDPSVLLREKLSELDTITKSIKARVLNRVESSKVSASTASPLGVPLAEAAQSHVGGGDEPGESARHQCHTCACHKAANVGEGESDKRIKDKKHSKAFGDHQSPASQNEGKRSMHKQRRTWERNEDLIDFGSMCMEDEDEEQQAPHSEDMSEWLTEAALQQVFNPFLFNDILNSMNSSRGGVQVIELDDTENSDDNDDTAASVGASDNVKPEGSYLQSENGQNWSRRGDETYRKRTAHFPSNMNAPNHHIRSGTVAGDADSGVDVDLSANFHSGYRAAATQPQYFTSHLRNNMGVRTASSEREESSSCSFSSRHQQSTVPSSASATPSDSPQHLHSIRRRRN